MTSTLDETDLDWLTLIDYEQEICCEAEKCDRPAEWKLVTKCCGATYLICNPCKEEECRHISSLPNPYCVSCGKKFVGDVSPGDFAWWTKI